MLKEFEFKDNKLLINNKFVEFSYLIKDAQLLIDRVIVLLAIPTNNETIDNLYSVDKNGNIIWQSQSLKEIYPTEKLLPYEEIMISNNEIKAIDFYGRRYFIDSKNGKITKRDIAR